MAPSASCLCSCLPFHLTQPCHNADQLQRAVERHEYSEAAHLVEAVQQLSMHFQSFAQIPKVAELAGRVATLQRSLQMNVMREFELLGTGEESTNPLLLERLKACCLVTDALGYKVGVFAKVLMWYDSIVICVVLCGVSVHIHVHKVL